MSQAGTDLLMKYEGQEDEGILDQDYVILAEMFEKTKDIDDSGKWKQVEDNLDTIVQVGRR